MMSKRIAMCTAAAGLLMLLASPVSFADQKDPDMADRIYEKYKEREQGKQREKRSRSSSSDERNKRNESRDNTRREERRASSRDRQSTSTSQNRNQSREQSRDRSNDQRKSREVSREQREFVQSRSRSETSERRTTERRSTRSSAREERSSREAGEQLSTELRNLFNRKSQQGQSSGSDTRRTYVPANQARPSSGSRQSDTGENVSLDQAVNIVRRQTDGKVISAKSEGSGSSRKHRIKVLIGERRVRTYIVSASTGKVY